MTSGPDRMTADNAEGNEEGEAAAEEGEAAAVEGEGDNEETKEEKEKVDPLEKFTEGEDIYDPVTAVVRLKIPKVQPEPEVDEDGNPVEVEIVESDLDDIPFEDRCLSSVAKQDEQQIWVLNQLAQKTLRTDLSNEFRGMSERLEHLDTQDFNYRMEKEAAAFEQNFLDLLSDHPEFAELKTPKIPVFDFRPKY